MKKPLMLLASVALLAELAAPALAYDRYAERPPVVVSPDLSAPWVLQLGRSPAEVVPAQQSRSSRRAADAMQPAQAQPVALRAPEKRAGQAADRPDLPAAAGRL